MVFGPCGDVSRVCLAGVYWDVRETFVVRGRGAGRSLVVCIFIFMYESRDIFCRNQLVSMYWL